ncbi:hypothetical protein [Lichenifustis flavocetrariae]|uniref:Uncharacterized protein n=1 Tax=Lichenifustis flavocetrariae TaxID=2949735 RepID=A0AA42CNS3_9HYPH|nr:hypothetical protein [Lichenifustis flavocetrariae]MCW6509692.1 hypothetical protein [Lichenifustis flavocetrariae]
MEERKCLISKQDELLRDYAGLSISDMLKDFDASEPPHFKEAAAIIRAVQNAVECFDGKLLEQIDLKEYLRGLLSERLGRGPSNQSINRKHAVRQTWGHQTSKGVKVLRILAMVGVHKVVAPQSSPKKVVATRKIPDELIHQITNMSQAEALEFLSAD